MKIFDKKINKKEEDMLFNAPIYIVGPLMLLVPWIVYKLTSHVVTPGISTDNDWIGFFGGFIPGMFSSLITFYVLLITTNQTRKIQDENSNAVEKQQRREFVQKIATLVGEYCSTVSLYYSERMEILQLQERVEELECEDVAGVLNRDTIEELKKLKTSLRYKATSTTKSKIVSMYYTLEILLSGINQAENLLQKIKDVQDIRFHEEYMREVQKLDDCCEEDKLKRFNDDVEEEIIGLVKESFKFTREYVDMGNC